MKIKIYVDWEEQDIIAENEVPSWLEKKVEEVLADKNLCHSYKDDFLDEEDENLSFRDYLTRHFRNRLKYDCQEVHLEV